MNLLFINHFAGIPKKSDASLRHFNIAKIQQKYNNQCSIITSSKSYQSQEKFVEKEKTIDGINYFFVDEFSTKRNNLFIKLIRMFSFGINLFWYLKRNSSKHNPDIVYASSPDLVTCLVAYYFSKKKKAKFFFEVRDIWPLSQIQLHNFNKNHPMILFLSQVELFLHKKADKIISNLSYYSRYLEDKKIKYKEFIYLPQFLDTQYYNQNYVKCDILNEHSKIFESYDNVCIYAGTIGKYYGLNYMIDSVRLFNYQKKSKLALILVGDGDYKLEAKDYCKKNNIDDIFIIDTQSKSYLFSLIDRCSFSIVSFPEKEIYKYGIASLKMFDYLYAGVPILMIGPFAKYSILKKSKYQFKSFFGDIDEMIKQYENICNLDLNSKNHIKDDYKNILTNYSSVKSSESIIADIFNN